VGQDREAGAPPFEGIVYQVYPRSFRDGDGDGVGDLVGMREGLAHLTWLGVDALWSSPIFRSPMADFGYDISDHSDVDPIFGTLDDLDALIADAHDRGLGVWLDYVPNHTSDRHPWFVAARSSRTDPHREFYVWRDPAPDGGPPNNWIRHFDQGPAWTLDEASGQYYLHHFLSAQPDVNWDHPPLREAQLDVLRFWLARGIDGFRADVIHLIGQDRSYPDDPADAYAPFDHIRDHGRANHHSHPSTFEHLRAIRAVLDPAGAPMVGEVTLDDAAEVLAHVGDEGLHLSFTFHLIHQRWDAAAWAADIARVDAAFAAAGAWPAWVLGNHDQQRIATRTGSRARARVAAAVQLTLRGVPFIYQGEELGLEDAVVPAERVVDPGGRDGCRAPIPWTGAADAGWPGGSWLPAPPDAAARSVAAQRDDAASSANLYRRLLALRRGSDVLRRGPQRVLGAEDGVPEGVLGVLRGPHEPPAADDADDADAAGDADARFVTLAQMSGTDSTVPAFAGWTVRIDTDGAGAREGTTFDGRLAADTAVVLSRD
jgi:alpha-glucosidase